MADKKHKHHNSLRHLLGFLDVGKPLKGKDLFRAARAEARISTMPQVHAYRRLARELGRESHLETRGLKRLGSKSFKAVGNVYDTLGSQAQQNMLTQQALGGQYLTETAQAGKAFGKGIATGQSQQVGDLLAQQQAQGDPQGSPAQAQLAQIVASQRQQAAADSRAAQAFAGSQAQGTAGLSANLAQSALLQGASAQAGIKSSTLSRVAESKMKYGQDIREARGKAADAKALMGSQIVQALQQLRGQEQQFKLGKMATHQDAQAAQLAAQTSRANSRRTAASSRASTAETHRHNVATENAAGHQSAQERRQAKKARHRDVKSIHHLVHQALNAKPASYWRKHTDALEHTIRTQGSFGDNEVNLVARIVHDMLKGKKGHGRPGVGPGPGHTHR